MKILEIDGEHYFYPQEILSIEEFIVFANRNFHSFIPLTLLKEEHCVSPYFIKEDTVGTFLNFSTVRSITEVEGTIYSREEYETNLCKVVQKVCVNCEHYGEDEEDDLRGHCDKIDLDGYCLGI